MKRDVMLDALKALRKRNRENEIMQFGKPICYSSITKCKKVYSRKIKHKFEFEL